MSLEGIPVSSVMQHRTPRTTVRRRGYLSDTITLLHPKMLLIILALVTIGHLVAPGRIDMGIYLLGLGGIVFAVLGSYRVNELHDQTTSIDIPRWHHIAIGIAFFAIALGFAIALAAQQGWWVIGLAAFGGLVSILYNLDVHRWIHNRKVYGLIWGGFPLVFSAMTQAGTPSPTAGAIILGIWASVVAVHTLWLWGPTTCGRMELCQRADFRPMDRKCHSPVLECRDRLVMPKGVHDHMKVLINLNLATVLLLTAAFWIFEFSGI